MAVDQIGGNHKAQLKGFAERIQSKEEAKDNLKGELKKLKQDVDEEYKAASNAGFSAKALKRAIKDLGLDDKQMELQLGEECEVDQYRKALGIMSREDLELKAIKERVGGSQADATASGPISPNNDQTVSSTPPPRKKGGKGSKGHLEVVK